MLRLWQVDDAPHWRATLENVESGERRGFPSLPALLEYLLTITNTGVVTDYYTLEMTTTWGSISILGGPGGPVPPGGSIQNIIAIPIPSDVYPGDQGESVITVTSMSNYAVVDTALFTTTVINFTTHMPFVWKN
jgi:hypothetical protein